MSKVSIKDFIKAHPVGDWCKGKPSNAHMPALRFGKLDVPEFVDNRSYCTEVEDQGTKPWCAAYTAAAFAENVLWRRDGRIKQIEPEPIYKWAKAHDGNPTGDGTSLDVVLNALLAKGVFAAPCKVKLVGRDEDVVKATIHRFGCFLGGFAITREWYDLSGGKTVKVVGKTADGLGGHAVMVCGYDKGGVWVENSWGKAWGAGGFGYLTWDAFRKQFMYGTVLTNCLNGFK